MKTKLLFTCLLTSLLGFSQNPIFTPGMTVTSFGIVDVPSDNEDWTEAIDGNQYSKLLDRAKDDGTAFTVDLGVDVTATAQSIDITSGNDAPERDPLAYEVQGSNDDTSYTSIAIGDIECDPVRMKARKFNFTTTNTIAYRYYRIIFPTLCDSGSAEGIQVAEVQLYDAIFSSPIFTAAMATTPHGDVDAPGAEDAPKATDGNQNTKFLDFNELDGISFAVDLGVGITAKAQAIEVTTANDGSDRDQGTYTVQGSNDPDVAFTEVATGSMACISERFNKRYFNFASAGTVAYRYYRVILTDICGSDLAQVSEVQLYGTVINATAGVNEHLFNEVTMYPNPTEGNVYFRNLGTLKNASIKLFNITGQLLKEEKGITSNNYELNIDVNAGLYFIEVSADNASKMYKLIKN